MTRHGQHTDGPWEVQPYQGDNGASLAVVSPDTGFTVAIIPFDEDMQTIDNPTYETVRRHPCDVHNANLISKAPAMYILLNDIAQSGLLHKHHGDESSDMLAQVQQMLIEARGQQ